MSGVSIVMDEAGPLLQRVKTAAAAKGLALVAARAVGGLVKEHLYGLDSQRHRFGSHYYRQAADSVTTGAVPQGAVVSITQIGFRLRLFGSGGLPGGVVRAKNVTFLTIPAHPEAYGVRARHFKDLDFQIVQNPKTGGLQPALVRRLSQAISFARRKQKDGTVKLTVKPGEVRMPTVMYWLARSVRQKPDPSVLPYNEHMAARGTAAISTRLARLQQRAAGDAEGNS